MQFGIDHSSSVLSEYQCDIYRMLVLISRFVIRRWQKLTKYSKIQLMMESYSLSGQATNSRRERWSLMRKNRPTSTTLVVKSVGLGIVLRQVSSVAREGIRNLSAQKAAVNISRHSTSSGVQRHLAEQVTERWFFEMRKEMSQHAFVPSKIEFGSAIQNVHSISKLVSLEYE